MVLCRASRERLYRVHRFVNMTSVLTQPYEQRGLTKRVGDMMQMMTNSYLPSTPHKVALNTRERFAFAYFHEPNFNAICKTFPEFHKGTEKDRETMHYGTHFSNMLVTSTVSLGRCRRSSCRCSRFAANDYPLARCPPCLGFAAKRELSAVTASHSEADSVLTGSCAIIPSELRLSGCTRRSEWTSLGNCRRNRASPSVRPRAIAQPTPRYGKFRPRNRNRSLGLGRKS